MRKIIAIGVCVILRVKERAAPLLLRAKLCNFKCMVRSHSNVRDANGSIGRETKISVSTRTLGNGV